MGKLTTHVLDISAGIPAAGLAIELHRADAPEGPALVSAVTGPDGRCPSPLLEGVAFAAGRYRLTYRLAAYFRARNVALPDPPFIEDAVIHLGIAEPGQHYHVPLLVTPWSYSVYRGG